MKAAKLYYTSVNRSYRHVKRDLINAGTEHEVFCINETPITWEQLLEILMHTENGIEDILAVKSASYKELVEEGIDFDGITLSEFHNIVVNYPSVMRSPILVVKDTTLVGYNSDEMSILYSRKDRMKKHYELLSAMREMEEQEDYESLTAW